MCTRKAVRSHGRIRDTRGAASAPRVGAHPWTAATDWSPGARRLQQWTGRRAGAKPRGPLAASG
eukprot:7147449-Prymnesium_polylepis.1